MARQLMLFIVSILLLTCISFSCGNPTGNVTGDESSNTNHDEKETLLDGWIKLANGFVNAVSPKDLSAFELLAELFVEKKTSNAKDIIFNVFRIEAAFAACLFLGLIYFLVMGSGWSCFLCCRCCGNCGANKTQRQTKNINTRRCTYVLLTIVVLGFLAAAVSCAFMANEEMHWLLTKSNDSIHKVFDRVETFVSNTQEDVTKLTDRFEVQMNEVASDEKITSIVGQPLKDKVGSQQETKDVTETLKELDKKFQGLKELEDNVNIVINKEKKVGDLKDKIQKLKNTCQPSDTGCDEINKLRTSDFEVDDSASFDNLPSKLLLTLKELKKLNLHQDFQKKIEEIPKKIVHETGNPRKEMLKKLEKFTQSNEIVNNFEYVNNKTNEYEEETSKFYSKYIADHENYRYWGVFGLIMLVTLPSGLLLFGLCCGLLGSKSGRYPSERSGLSHIGGCTMMASVYMMFIFGSLTMLITAAFFQVGGHVEAYGCRYINEKDFTTVNKILHMFVKNDSKSYWTSLNVGDIVSKCENNSAILEAIPSIEEMMNVNLNFEEEVDKLNFDKYSDEIDKMIKDALIQIQQDGIAIGQIGSIKELNALPGLVGDNIIKADLTKTVEDLAKVDNTSNDERNKLLEDVLGILKNLTEASTIRGEIKKVVGGIGSDSKIDEYHKELENAKTEVNAAIKTIEPKIQEAAKELVKTYGNSVVKEVKDFAKGATNTVKTQVGKCKPLYEAFSIGRHFACRQVLGPVNALWFSLGACCFLFLFAIPFATKLSKHYYIMDEDEDSYIGMDTLHGHHINGYAENQVVLYKGGNDYSKGPQRPMHHQNGAYEPDIDERWTRY